MRASRASPDSPSSWPWPTRMRGVWAGSRFFTRSARGSVDGWRVVSGEATIVAMTTPLPSRWPQLHEYYDSWRIKSHWPRGMGTIWCLPPAINIWFWLNVLDPDRYGPWYFSQRLYDNSGTTQRYEKTKWHVYHQDFTVDVWSHSILRHYGWEYSFQGFLYDEKSRLVGLGENRTRYASYPYQQYPPWMEDQQVVGKPSGHPYMGFLLHAWPTSLRDAWPAVPTMLGDGAETGSTVPEFPGDSS